MPWNRRFWHQWHRFLEAGCPSCHVKKHKALKGTQGNDTDQQKSPSSLILTGFVQKTVDGLPDFFQEKITYFQTFEGDFYLHIHQRNTSKSTAHDKIPL